MKDFGPGNRASAFGHRGKFNDFRTCGSPDQNVRFHSFDNGEEIGSLIALPFGVFACEWDLSMRELVALGLQKESGLINTPEGQVSSN